MKTYHLDGKDYYGVDPMNREEMSAVELEELMDYIRPETKTKDTHKRLRILIQKAMNKAGELSYKEAKEGKPYTPFFKEKKKK